MEKIMTVKNMLRLSSLLILTAIISGCSLFQKDDNSAPRGGYIWWNDRQNVEMENTQLNSQFDDQGNSDVP